MVTKVCATITKLSFGTILHQRIRIPIIATPLTLYKTYIHFSKVDITLCRLFSVESIWENLVIKLFELVRFFFVDITYILTFVCTKYFYTWSDFKNIFSLGKGRNLMIWILSIISKCYFRLYCPCYWPWPNNCKNHTTAKKFKYVNILLWSQFSVLFSSICHSVFKRFNPLIRCW